MAEIKTRVKAMVLAVVKTTGQLKGNVTCPQCGGTIPWYYNGDDLNFFCNTNACVFSSPSVRDAVLEAEAQIAAGHDVKAPLVLTGRRSSVTLSPEAAWHKAEELRAKLQHQAMNDRMDGAGVDHAQPDTWVTYSHQDKMALERAAIDGLADGQSTLGDVVEHDNGGDMVEVRRVLFRGRKTHIWLSRAAFEGSPMFARRFGKWPEVVHPDLLGNTISVGNVERPS